MSEHEIRDAVAVVILVPWALMLVNVCPMLIVEPEVFGRWHETVLAVYLVGWGYLGSHVARHFIGADGDD